jgi:hypothetical protein
MRKLADEELSNWAPGLSHAVDAARGAARPAVPFMKKGTNDIEPPARRHRRPGRLRQDGAVRNAVPGMRERYDMAVITNDIYTREDMEILLRADALPPERLMGVETGGCPHTAIREDASINLEAIARLQADFPPGAGAGRVRRRQPGRHLQPGAVGPDDVRDRRRRRREDPAQGRSRHHPLGPADHQQDRPGAARGRRTST